MSKRKTDPCKSNACKIQACLSENNYQEEKCLHALEEMRQCCLKWHKESFVCQGIDLERKYLPAKDEKKQQPKPPPEIQAAIDAQLAQQQNATGQKRRTTTSVPKRNWMQRNPKLFQITIITTSLLAFFSKPLYDAFIADPLPPPREKIPPHKR